MRQLIRLMLGACVALCFYLPTPPLARAQQPPQSNGAASSSTTSGSTKAPAAQTSTKSQPPDAPGRASESLIDGSIKNDPELEKIIAPYKTKVDELNTPIGKLSGDLKRDGIGGGSIGNFVTDALRAIAEKKLGKPVLLAVTNTSGMRKSLITAGELRASDIYELLPFENSLITLDLTGEQLLRFMQVNVQRRNAQSGAHIVYHDDTEKKQYELVSMKLDERGAERDIDPKATYTIVTIDYLVKRGGDYSVLQEGKNVHPLNVTMRDAVIEYVKAETAAGRAIKANLDGRFKGDVEGQQQ